MVSNSAAIFLWSNFLSSLWLGSVWAQLRPCRADERPRYPWCNGAHRLRLRQLVLPVLAPVIARVLRFHDRATMQVPPKPEEAGTTTTPPVPPRSDRRGRSPKERRSLDQRLLPASLWEGWGGVLQGAPNRWYSSECIHRVFGRPGRPRITLAAPSSPFLAPEEPPQS